MVSLHLHCIVPMELYISEGSAVLTVIFVLVAADLWVWETNGERKEEGQTERQCR